MGKISGLSTIEAQELLKENGYNELHESERLTPLKLLLRQLKSNFILYLLIIAAGISFFVGESLTGITIFFVTIIVVTVGFFQEYRAEQAMKSLKNMMTPTSIVRRDGKDQEILSREIVRDDIVVLRTGERIPADCIVVEQNNVRVNESMLTGESNEVEKSLDDMIYMGSYVVNGRCLAKVVHTGENTRFGHIVQMISRSEKALPLQTKVNAITRIMVLISLTISIATGLFMLTHTDNRTIEAIIEILIVVIALSVSAFPEGLPLVLLTSLATGASRMAKKNAIVNRMSIIETLGETTIICSDKTGTITTGQMTVKRTYVDGQMLNITGVGYNRLGELKKDDHPVTIVGWQNLEWLLKAAIICNDAKIDHIDGDEYKIFGSPTEAALVVLAAKGQTFVDDLAVTRLEERPFDSKRKMMSVLCSINDKQIVFAKGAPEVIIEHCRLAEADKQQLFEVVAQFTQQAYRVLAIATAEAGSDYNEDNLDFIGLVALEDPPREEVKRAIAECKDAGIQIKMITGDSKHTATAIAQLIGLDNEVLEGTDIDALTDDELVAALGKATILARVKPEHKLRVVQLLKKQGEIVTMTGDGVNDAPALKEAHIGVAMGKNGTDVSRSVADLTLKDDNFATIVEAVREGRTIFNNIRKFTSYQLSVCIAELIVLFCGVLLSPLFGWQIPLLVALQILFINLVTDDIPALTLAFNRTSHDVMRERPRKNAEILNKPLMVITLVTGLFMAAATLLAYYLAANVMGLSNDTSRTVALVTLILLAIVNAFNFRSFRFPTLTRSPLVNPYLFFAAIGSCAATAVIIYTPLNEAFETHPLQFELWFIALFIAFVFITVFDIAKELNAKYKFLQTT